MTRKNNSAAAQFAAMGIDPKDFTETMELAVKQKWSGLPVDEKVDDLRAQIADVEVDPTPTADMLQATGFSRDPDACRVEAARLKRNATVNAWRRRGQLQAALDAREIKFAKVRAKRAAAKNGDPVAAAS